MALNAGAHDRDASQLIDRARLGDATAWETIVLRHYDEVWKLSWALVRDRATADDITQETFLTVREKLGQFRAANSLRYWILAICRNRCRDEFRRRHRRALDFSLDAPPTERRPSGRSIPASDEDAELASEERLALEWALNTLEAGEREAVVLTYMMGYSSEEAARIVGVPPSTLRSRLARALRKLRDQLAS